MERPRPVISVTSIDAFIDGLQQVIAKNDTYIPELRNAFLTYMGQTVVFKGLPREVTAISLNNVNIDFTILRSQAEINSVPEYARQTWDLLQIDEYAQQRAEEIGLNRKRKVTIN